MIRIFNGVEYDIPEEELSALNEYIDKEWNPCMEKGMMTDSGTKRIPTNTRALSFTLFLKEWYGNKFQKYVVS